jgi:adenylate kinase
MNGRVVAVLGISGVGKTTMVSNFTAKHAWVHSVRASNLLKEAVAVTDTEALRKVSAPDIQSNQDRLTIAFNSLRRAKPDRHIIFDGHSLIDNDDGLVIIPADIFREIAPNLIVYLEDDPNTILARRSADIGRIRPTRTLNEITRHQDIAKEAAINYGVILSVECRVVQSGDSRTFEHALSKVFQPLV